MNFKSYQDLSFDIKRRLHVLQKEHFDLVVGIPRSGMIPAHIIASLLNINCTDSVSFCHNLPLKHGRTRPPSGIGAKVFLPSDAQSVLLVDDSINTGQSMAKEAALVRQAATGKIRTMAVYSSVQSREDVDFFCEYVPMPRAFEWNLFHHSVLAKACVDIDGVLCVDPTEEENDDGPRYREFLLSAAPLILPSKPIFALVTSRLEKYRKETEAWLKANNVIWKHLIMLDLPSKEERIRRRAHASHKADYYKTAPARFFIESNDKQAREISHLSKKVVYCTESGRLYLEGRESEVIYHRRFLYDGSALSVRSLLFKRYREFFERALIKKIKN